MKCACREVHGYSCMKCISESYTLQISNFSKMVHSGQWRIGREGTHTPMPPPAAIMAMFDNQKRVIMYSFNDTINIMLGRLKANEEATGHFAKISSKNL